MGKARGRGRTMAALGAALGAAALASAATVPTGAHAQAASIKEVEIGSLTCSAAGGAAFAFGTSRDLDCLLARNDGVGERFKGNVTKFAAAGGGGSGGIVAKDARLVVWLVFVAGQVSPGVIAGDYAPAGAQAAAKVGLGGNGLAGGNGGRIVLLPLSIEGRAGLNAAAGIAQMSLQVAP